MTPPVISVSNLSLTLGGTPILKGVTFKAERGSFVAIAGPNGAGKSTLLKCVGGLRRNFAGEIEIDGQSIKSMSKKEIARRIAWVHQTSSGVFPFTVREFAGMSRYPWHGPFEGLSERDEEIIVESLAEAGVSDLSERSMSSLSGGERQRALIAAALAQGTDILFLDEPTSFLDYKHQLETLEIIESVNRDRGMTVVMVTHDINLATHGADEIIAIKSGELVWRGKPSEFVTGGTLSDIFETEFETFETEGRAHYVAPAGFVR